MKTGSGKVTKMSLVLRARRKQGRRGEGTAYNLASSVQRGHDSVVAAQEGGRGGATLS